jgi:hypothetical protein
MAYSDFKNLGQAVKDLSLNLENRSGLFSNIQPIEPSEKLKSLLADYLELATNIGTEKARSELIVAPILLDVRRHLKNRISYFSGSTLNVNAEKGLTGECGFVLSNSVNQLEISAPVLTVVEAKKSDIKLGLGQCAAQMVGAQYFNRSQGQTQTIYGAVTTGEIWKFMCLEEELLSVDLSEYYITQLSSILGTLAAPFLELHQAKAGPTANLN